MLSTGGAAFGGWRAPQGRILPPRVRHRPEPERSLDRRHFLRLAALAPLTLPPVSAALAAAFSSALAAPVPASPAGLGTRPALIALRAALRVEARQANDPWSICHAMLGIGPDLRLENGQVAVDYLFTNFLKHEADGGPYFEVAGHGTLMGEQHPFLVLKKCVELKLRPELWKPLADTGLRKLRMPATQDEWDDITWLLWAVAKQPGFAADTRVGPDRVRLDAVALGALERVERADLPVEAAWKAGGALGFQRPSSGDAAAHDSVWGFTCGGQHLLQSVVACQEMGFLPAATRPRVEACLATLQRRLVGESNFRQAEKKKATAAGMDVTLVEHQSALALLKLNGHALETFGRARDAGFGDAVALLAGAHGDADRLEQSQLAFQMRVPLAPYLASIRTKSAANWRLWLGDGCHALHGFGYWKELARRA